MVREAGKKIPHLLINLTPVSLLSRARPDEGPKRNVSAMLWWSWGEQVLGRLPQRCLLTANLSAWFSLSVETYSCAHRAGVSLQMLHQMTLIREQICYKLVRPAAVVG